MTSHRKTTALAGAAEVTTDRATVTAPVRSKPLRLDESEVLKRKAALARQARYATGCTSPAQLSPRVGVSESIIKQQESAAYDKEPRLSQMLAVREYGLYLAGEVAKEHGATVVPLPAAEPVADSVRITVECADVVRLAAIHGPQGPDERHELDAEERELLELEAEVMARLAFVRARRAAMG